MEFGRVKRTPSWLLFVTAVVFAIALAGCGNQAGNSSSTGSETGDSASVSASVDGSTALSDATKSILSGVDASKSVDLSTLLTEGDESVAKLEAGDIGVGIDDESKAPAGQTLITCGGIETFLPSTWKCRMVADGWRFLSRDGRFEGGMLYVPRSASQSYDVEKMAASVPQQLYEYGATDCQVMHFDNVYSNTGTLCASYVYCDAMFGGQTYRYFYEFVLSASYVNCLCLQGDVDDVIANADELGSIVNSLAFIPGEEI